MKKNKQPDGMPVWFDGKSINEALFCDEFLQTHKIIFTNGALFTPEGRVTDELPLRGEIFEELKCCAVSNIPRKISNIVELMKLAALVEDFPPEADRIIKAVIYRRKRKGRSLHNRGCDQSLIRKYFLMNGNGIDAPGFSPDASIPFRSNGGDTQI